jgi:protein-L-isoaspartate O-methyltransferase
LADQPRTGVLCGHKRTLFVATTKSGNSDSIRFSTAMLASSPEYALGSTDAEQERLIRQASRLAPLTERAFLDAGIGPGQRVLELGSGVGDVAMLVARIVGPAGEVIGIERDSRTISRARTRVINAGLSNVTFVERDIFHLQSAGPFDAALGRFILQFLPDPVGVLRSLSQLVRPGGILVFQEVSYAPLLALSTHLPLWSASVSIARDTVQRLGAKPEMGIALHRTFQEAGLPAPTMRMEVLLGNTQDFTLWIYDVLCSLRPQMEKHSVSVEALGDFKTLSVRLQSEVAQSKAVVPYLAVVGAWSRKPAE